MPGSICGRMPKPCAGILSGMKTSCHRSPGIRSYAISTFLEDHGAWEGTAEQLLQQLCAIDPDLNLKANFLARKLNAQIKVLQDTYGIRYQWHRNAEGKWISLEFMSDVTDDVR